MIWTTKTNIPLTNDLRALLSPSIKRVAIANPDHAPYGRAARDAFKNVRIWDDIQARLVLGENISQTLQFVQTGNADVGIVSLSLVKAPRLQNIGRYVEVPPETYPPLEQGAVLTRNGKGNSAARNFLKFLQSARAREIFDSHGFQLPARKEPAR